MGEDERAMLEAVLKGNAFHEEKCSEVYVRHILQLLTIEKINRSAERYFEHTLITSSLSFCLVIWFPGLA